MGKVGGIIVLAKFVVIAAIIVVVVLLLLLGVNIQIVLSGIRIVIAHDSCEGILTALFWCDASIAFGITALTIIATRIVVVVSVGILVPLFLPDQLRPLPALIPRQEPGRRGWLPPLLVPPLISATTTIRSSVMMTTTLGRCMLAHLRGLRVAQRRPLEQAAAAATSLAMFGRAVAIAGAGPSIAPTGIGLGTMVLLIAVAAVVDDAVGIVDGIFPGV